MEFYVTTLNLDTLKGTTGSIEMFDGATTEDINKYFAVKCTERYLILSVWSAQEVAEMIVHGVTPPPEMLRYFGELPEPDVEKPDEWTDDDYEKWYGSQKSQDDDEEDYEDGDEWKRLLT